MKSKVSIIIPAYNAELTLNKCLDSIVSQTYNNLEIIVVNDGSIDNTKKIVEEYKRIDDRIFFINQENSGVSEARNSGLKNSTGEFTIFIDCDDWLEKNMIEIMVDYQKKYNVDVVRCNFYDDKIKGTKVGNIYNLSNKKIYNSDFDKVREHFLLAREPIKNLVMLLLIKKDILINNNILYNKELYMMEDVLYYQKIFSAINSIYFLDMPLYHYCENKSSVTNSPAKYEKMIYGILSTNKVLTKYLIENNLLSDKINLLNANHIRIIIIYLYYIYIFFGRKKLMSVLLELNNNKEFKHLLNYCDISQISTQFRLFFKTIFKKHYNCLCILFTLKKIKER